MQAKRQETSDVVKSRLKAMTLKDKIGQMAQLDINMILEDDGNGGKQLNMDQARHFIGELGVGSVLNTPGDVPWTARDYRKVAIQLQSIAQNYSRPLVIWGIDSVHGANYVHGASLPPQPLNIAATFNTTVSYRAGRLAARDTLAAGIPWLFSPLLGLAWEPRWSRYFETFGEDPVVVGSMALSMIRGIQEDSKASACAKHFIGYSMPHNGHDRSPSWVPTRHLYQYFVPPWQKVIGTVDTVMESYSETDGVPEVANRDTLRYLLRGRLGFDGMLVTDYSEIRNLHDWHLTASSFDEAHAYSLQQGSVDMSMIAWNVDDFFRGVSFGLDANFIDENRIDESVERVLRLKEKVVRVLEADEPDIDLVGSDDDEVLDMAHQSLILAKNLGSTLPILGRQKVLVTGPTSTSLVYQSGAWTWKWQGADPAETQRWFSRGTTVLGAAASEASWDISFSCGTSIDGSECDDVEEAKTVLREVEDWVMGAGTSIDRAAEKASGMDYVIVCIGEQSNTEKEGDTRSMRLPDGQHELVRRIRETSDAKIVLVYFGGRARLLENMVDQSDAVIVGFLPGPMAGQAVVDVLSGRYNPSGRMPVSYPKYDDNGGIPYMHTVSDRCRYGQYSYSPCEVQWPFGYGESYTSFEYSDLSATGGLSEDLDLTVRVKNTGLLEGSIVVMFFTFDMYRIVSPEYKRLRAFQKITLRPGEERVVSESVPLSDLAFIGPHDDKHYVFDPTKKFWVGVGPDIDCRRDSSSSLCLALNTDSVMSPKHLDACSAACEVWDRSDCWKTFDSSEGRCMELCSSIVDDGSPGNDGWGWNYVQCIESVVWGYGQPGQVSCWKMTSLCRDIFGTQSLDEFGRGTLSLTPTAGDHATLASVVAFFSSSIAVLFIALVMRGRGCSKRPQDDNIQFSVVQTDSHDFS